MGLAQVPAGKSRPEPHAHGSGLRGYLLFAPLRPEYAARGNHGGARYRRAQRSGVVRRYFLLWATEDPRGRGHPARTGDTLPDSSAVLFDAQPLGGTWPAGGARAGRYRLHSVLPP